MTLTFQLPDPDSRAPVFLHYTKQTDPQPAFLILSVDGKVTATIDSVIGGVPIHVWSAQTLRWRIDHRLSGQDIHDLIAMDGVSDLLHRVHTGHSIVHDGSAHRGRLTADAREASDRLEQICREFEPSQDVMRAKEYLQLDGPATQWFDDRSRHVEEIADHVMWAAEDCNTVIFGGRDAVIDALHAVAESLD